MVGDTRVAGGLVEVPGVMDRLKAETAERHSNAESRPFQRRLVAGRVAPEEYRRWLGQMFLIHRALEERLRSHAPAEPRIGLVITDEQCHEIDLRADLKDLGLDVTRVAPMPLPSTRALTDRIAAASAIEVMGMHYVLEGSTNGNKYIAKSLRRSLGLIAGSGDRYLDPYGDDQRQRWAAFKAAMDDIAWTVAEADAMVSGAQDMFDGISALSTDLMP